MPFDEYALDWIKTYQGRGRCGFREETRSEYTADLKSYAIPYFYVQVDARSARWCRETSPASGASDPRHGGAGRVSLSVVFRCRLATSAAGSTSLGDAASYGVGGCLDAVLEVELGEDAGDVVGDGVRAH